MDMQKKGKAGGMPDMDEMTKKSKGACKGGKKG